MRRRLVRALGALLVSCGAVLLARSALATLLVTLVTPHAARAPAATLSASFGKDLDARASAASLDSVDALSSFALRETTSELHFGLSHRTSLAFDGAEREGNCVEYAELFASIFNRERRGIDARAWVVRSDARLFGEPMRDPAFRDHDWVLVVVRTPKGVEKRYIDPTFYDMGLGADVSGAVRGEVRVPE